MTKFTYINDNLDRLKEEVKMGLVSPSVLYHYSIFCRFDFYRKQENNVSTSVFYTSEDFKINEGTVYRVIKSMNI